MPKDRTTSIAIMLILAVTVVFMYLQGQKAQQRQDDQRRQEEQQKEAPESDQQPAPSPPEVAESPPAVEPRQPDRTEGPPRLLPDNLPSSATEEAPADTQPAEPPPEQPPEEVAVPEEALLKARTYSLAPEGGRFRLLFNSYGATLESARLLDYWASHRHRERFKLLEAYKGQSRRWTSLAMSGQPADSGPPLDRVNYEVGARGANFIEFHHTFADGLKVSKRFELPQGEHLRHLILTVTFTRTSGPSDEYQYELLGGARVRAEYFDRNYLEAAVAARQIDTRKTDVSKKDPGDLLDHQEEEGEPYRQQNNVSLPIMWVGSTNKYFAALLKPLSPDQDTAAWIARAQLRGLEGTEAVLKNAAGEAEAAEVRKRFDNTLASLVTNRFTVAQGEPVTHRYLFYMGPKDRNAFERVPVYRESDFGQVVDYGWFDFFSTILLKILNFFYVIIPNYGVAIILLTLVVRAALHPLTRKSQLSMRRMQALQPEIKKLQQKYKGDRQRLGKEQMELFKKHEVNPMGGCLPMFVQLPVIVGLFRAVQLSVDLREAPFVLWIHDLSRPDTIAHVAGWPINILPIAMIISMVVQQKLQPKAPDPQQRRQQRMMMIVMIGVLAFVFYNFASGVVLYWLTSTFVGIIEQRLVNRHWEKIQSQKASQAKGRK